MTPSGGVVGEDELQAWVYRRLPPERAEAVDAFIAAHPEVRARLSQYAEHRRALQAAFTVDAGELIPTRLRVGHILALRRRRRH